MPWPIRSCAAFQRLPSRWLSILALAAISSELTRVMTSAGTTSAPSTLHSGSPGRYRAGSPTGNAPMTAPCAEYPVHRLRPAATAITSSTIGNRGR